MKFGSIRAVGQVIATGSISSATTTILTGSGQLTNLGYATTGSNTFTGTQTMAGSIIPSTNNTYDLGSPTYQFRHVYISSGSLYVNGTKVLGSTSQELQITTDAGQSFKILEAGSDTITLQSADGNITMTTSGGGDVIMDPNTGVIALKGTTTVYSGYKIVSSDGNAIQFGNGIAITGSIVATGTSLVSGSSQITFSGLSGIPSGLVSGSSQVLSGTGIISSSAQESGFGYATTGSNTFQGAQTINGSLNVIGNLTAQQYIVSSSVTYLTESFTSGSHKFGDSADDYHDFTGSVRINGSIISTGTSLVSGSSQISYTGLSNIPSGIISGSSQLPSGIISGSAQLPSGTVSGSAQVLFTGTTGFGTYLNQTLLTSSSPSFATTTINGNINYTYSQSTVRSLWGGGYGGVIQLVSDNSTSTRYARIGISDSTNSWLGGMKIDNNYYATFDSYVGVGTTPSYPIDMTTAVSGTFSTIAQFQNTDYTSGNRTFIRVRAWANAGGSYSSYFGTGQDGNLYIIANNSARGGDLIINAGTGVITANGGGLVLAGTASDSIQSSGSPFLYLSGGGSSYTTIQQGGSKMRWWQFNGSSWIKTWDIDYNGNATLTGTFTENSSIRYKENVETVKYGLDKVLQMRGVTYNKKDNGIKEMGVIAEEINEILPEVVLKNDEGEVDSVSYGRIAAVLIEAIKDLKKEIEDLKSNK